jgi:hypothetical protein
LFPQKHFPSFILRHCSRSGADSSF